jgi:hypothetical protein
MEREPDFADYGVIFATLREERGAKYPRTQIPEMGIVSHPSSSDYAVTSRVHRDTQRGGIHH